MHWIYPVALRRLIVQLEWGIISVVREGIYDSSYPDFPSKSTFVDPWGVPWSFMVQICDVCYCFCALCFALDVGWYTTINLLPHTPEYLMETFWLRRTQPAKCLRRAVRPVASWQATLINNVSASPQGGQNCCQGGQRDVNGFDVFSCGCYDEGEREGNIHVHLMFLRAELIIVEFYNVSINFNDWMIVTSQN